MIIEKSTYTVGRYTCIHHFSNGKVCCGLGSTAMEAIEDCMRLMNWLTN